MADAEKSEKPTPRRLRQARREGQFPRTPDAATWLAIAVGAVMLPRSAAVAAGQFRELIRFLPEVAADPTPAVAIRALSAVPRAVAVSIAPACLGAAGGALLATAAQGVYLTTKGLKPKFSRLDPKQGIKRMLGPHAVWEAVKSLTKVVVIAVVLMALGRSLVPSLVGSGVLPLATTLARARHGIEVTLWAAASAGLVLAVADYGYQRRTVMKQLRMSPRDIKDEMKQTEGDPMVKGAIRSRQLAMSRNRMLSAVATADVVLVNPTHYSVALKYSPGAGAPRVVAKGAGAIAAKIRERARENRVPVVEDPPLARALYRVCELGEEIPSELYIAVARILAFVMRAGRPSPTARAARAPAESPVPDLPNRAALRARRAREVRATRPS